MTSVAQDWLGARPAATHADGPGVFALAASVLLTIVLAVVATAGPVLAHHLSPFAAIPAAVLSGIFIARVAPAQAPAVVIFAALFQNLFVSLTSPLITGEDEFNFVRGYNFLLTVSIWTVAYTGFLLDPAGYPAKVRRLVFWTSAALGVVGFYFLLGFAIAGSDAIIYLRNIALPLMFFQLCLLFAARIRVRITAFLVLLGVFFLLCGFTELFARHAWLAITNGYDYWRLTYAATIVNGGWDREAQETGIVVVDFLDLARVSLFNTTLLSDLDIQVMRLYGPNMHSIAFGYASAFMALFLIAAARPFLAALAIVLMVAIGAKGAIVAFGFVTFAWIGTRLFGSRPTVILFGLVVPVYAAFVIRSGLASGDYHILGLMGGLHGFMENPVGRGLGIGGNLSVDFESLDWNLFQAMGRTEGAMESAIGVILYQMGVGGFALIGAYAWIAVSAGRLYARTGLLAQGLAGYGTFIILVNGLFQEEALFSPLAIGLVLALAGLVLGAAARTETLQGAYGNRTDHGQERRRPGRLAADAR
jgi:hypothetical protein